MAFRGESTAGKLIGAAGARLADGGAGAIASALEAALSSFSAEKRLYALTVEGHGGPELLVEAFSAHEGLNEIGEHEVVALSTDAHVVLEDLLGRVATFHIALADDSRSSTSRLIASAQLLSSDGGFARYHLVLVPWHWLLTQQSYQRIWQDKTVLEILDTVFADPAYAPYQALSHAKELASYLAEVPARDYCVQYGETDYAFVARLLAEEGIGLALREDAAAPAGHPRAALPPGPSRRQRPAPAAQTGPGWQSDRAPHRPRRPGQRQRCRRTPLRRHGPHPHQIPLVSGSSGNRPVDGFPHERPATDGWAGAGATRQSRAMDGNDGTSPDSCWLRVAQRQAGAGFGTHFLPRIGQEVLIGQPKAYPGSARHNLSTIATTRLPVLSQ